MEHPWKYYPKWINKNESLFWADQLYSRLNWKSPRVRLFGKEHYVPRETTFLAKENINYKYSGTIHYGFGFPSWFLPLLNRVNLFVDNEFNGCLLNLYRDGSDSMGWHSDNEPELNKQSNIASLSFGATRDFALRNYHTSVKEILPLSNGDLLVMYPECQDQWKHSLPKRTRVKEWRINLTFRSYSV